MKLKIKRYIQKVKEKINLIELFDLKKNYTKRIWLIIVILITFFSLQVYNVSAFNYPEKSSNPYVQDNANIFSDETKQLLFEVGKKMKEEKNIQLCFATIKESVGEKEVYTERLKEWWNIGEDCSGIFVVIYPNSKDTYGIIVDSTLESYISETDTKEYKKEIEYGVTNNSIDVQMKNISRDIVDKLKDCSKQDTFFLRIKESINIIMNNSKIRGPVDYVQIYFDKAIKSKLSE